jgi:tRNA(adenine34) deaminase
MSLLFPLGPPDDPAERDRRIMQIALREADAAGAQDEVPVGALVVLGNRILGRSGNQVEQLRDATAHAEMLALSQAFAAVGNKRLVGAELFCTLEPCVMCAGAIMHARIARVVYGADDEKFGGVCSLCRSFELPGVTHKVQAVGGLEAELSATMLRAFFQQKRRQQARQKGGPTEA